MKKTAIVICIVLFVLILLMIAGRIYLAKKPAVPDDYWENIKSNGKIEARYNSLGSYAVQTEKYDAPQDDRDREDNFYQIWYPSEEGKYPLVVIVNGTGVPCSKYEAVFRHIASYGYVVIGNNYGTNWDGLHASETLQFALDTDEIRSRIDAERIAIGGHSQGGMGTFNAITEYDNGSLYQAAFSLSPTNDDLAIQLRWGFHLDTEEEYAFRLNEINIPMMMVAGTGKLDRETISPLEEMKSEYDSLAGDKVMFRRSGDADHGVILYEANGYVIAWLDYYLKGVSANESAFYGENAEISGNARYQDFHSEKSE